MWEWEVAPQLDLVSMDRHPKEWNSDPFTKCAFIYRISRCPNSKIHLFISNVVRHWLASVRIGDSSLLHIICRQNWIKPSLFDGKMPCTRFLLFSLAKFVREQTRDMFTSADVGNKPCLFVMKQPSLVMNESKNTLSYLVPTPRWNLQFDRSIQIYHCRLKRREEGGCILHSSAVASADAGSLLDRLELH